MQPSNKLADKRVLVTGGSKGIGYAMAKKFLAEGAPVMITGRKEDALKKAAEEIGCQYWLMDVSDTGEVRKQFVDANLRIGGFNCLVNNAGISLHEKSFFDVTEAHLTASFQ